MKVSEKYMDHREYQKRLGNEDFLTREDRGVQFKRQWMEKRTLDRKEVG